jgi:myo-inositol 2-dehydrogenase / D-chiro-inositol 1-dehydrogenase
VRHWSANGILADKPEAFFLQRYAAAYRLEIAHFFETLQSGGANGAFKTTIADGVAAQKLADAATASYKSGLPVMF